ncbi:hypothetical protein Vadar_023029 [Vaccinium darrowii]|uniref:Uncharacterized protein n=1 Tax=Vaccinium darrowii TaxID=229202 RepID=A0ACB7Z5Q3_9ERIC|nr:hypothetical protein Vadar_023029 [Vaccinium darrowii]
MDTEQSVGKAKHSGSSSSRRHIPQDRASVNEQLMRDYFAKDPVFPADKFRRRFRMNLNLFLRILNIVRQHNNYFVQKVDAAGFVGLSRHQKMTVAFRMLEYDMLLTPLTSM